MPSLEGVISQKTDMGPIPQQRSSFPATEHSILTQNSQKEPWLGLTPAMRLLQEAVMQLGGAERMTVGPGQASSSNKIKPEV